MSMASGSEVETRDYRGTCRRGFFRVTTWLPIRVSRLSESSAADLARELDAPAEESATVSDSQLEARLGLIERKLDLLLKRAGYAIDLPLSNHEKREVQLSGSGLHVDVPGFLRCGDLAQVELELPEERGRAIQLLGQIVSDDAGRTLGEQRGVALIYRSIRDRDREAIVRHAYEVQRICLGRVSGREDLR